VPHNSPTSSRPSASLGPAFKWQRSSGTCKIGGRKEKAVVVSMMITAALYNPSRLFSRPASLVLIALSHTYRDATRPRGASLNKRIGVPAIN